MPKKQTAPPAKRGTPQLPPPKRGRFEEAVENAGADEVEIVDEMDATPQSALQTYTAVPQLDPNDLFIPKLRIGQGLSAEVAAGDAKIGDWLMTGTEPMKSCTIIPLLMTRRRELRDKDGDRAVVCRSADSIRGVGMPGGECASCPMNQWKPNPKGGKNIAPPCIFIYSYMVYVADVNELAVLEFYRTSMSAGKLLNTIILQKGLGNFAVKLSSQLTKNAAGTYAMPSVVATKLDPKQLAAAQKKVKEMGFGS